MKVAVIGTGIAGNVAAYHLTKSHDVEVFEANDYIGGHTHTHDIEYEGKHYSVDSGFIVFNERTYPNFIQLLDELGVESCETEMSFSVKSEKTGLEYNGNSLNTLFAQRRNLVSPSFYRMIRDILRFNRQAPLDLESGCADLPLGQYLVQGQYSSQFIEHYIIPMGAAIWSSSLNQIYDFPARFFIRFFINHGLLQVHDRPRWFVIKGGSHAYVKKITASFRDRIHLNTPVEQVRRRFNHVEVKPKGRDWQYFDAVFFATHSDQALRLLDDPSDLEKEVLGAIRYQTNEAVLHTDSQMLPRRKLAWASWNYHLLRQGQQHPAAVTYYMNRLQHIDAPLDFCVTLNNSENINPARIIRRMSYDHPVFTAESVQAQQRQHEINGADRTYFCGAYWRNGFHEDGVVSALNAIKHFEEAQQHEELSLPRAS